MTTTYYDKLFGRIILANCEIFYCDNVDYYCDGSDVLYDEVATE
jgi:hypothetical protein